MKIRDIKWYWEPPFTPANNVISFIQSSIYLTGTTYWNVYITFRGDPERTRLSAFRKEFCAHYSDPDECGTIRLTSKNTK